MGRKIPAKKHRGVKDPLEQQARREKSLKSKINAPPQDPDEQPVPRSLTRLFAFQDKPHTSSKLIKNKKRTNEQKCSKDKNPVSGLKRLPGESGRSFSLRINSAVRSLGAAAAVLDSYPQDMESEDVKGSRMAELRARRQRKRRAAVAAAEPGPSRAERRAQAQRERAHQAERDRTEVRYERVQFGDVAHAPPALPARRGGGGGVRPGARRLLLAPLLAGGGAPPARGELARRDAVAAYRALNAQRRQDHRPHLNKLNT